jgi:thiamine pyrophosphate-dependent acetolactate synthase large subunit-like protein
VGEVTAGQVGTGQASAPGTLDRRAAVARLLADRKDLLVITGLGSSSYDVMAAGDHDHNFYLWGAMGSAAMVGLGLASAKPKHAVLVLTGDGEMLMGFGALATIALRRPANLTIAVLDNGHYAETGMQVSHTGRGISLDQVARSCGFSWVAEIRDMAGVDDLRARLVVHDGVKFATIKIVADTPARVLPPRDGVHVKNRFRAALGYGVV